MSSLVDGWKPGDLVKIVGPALGQSADDPEEAPHIGLVVPLAYPRGEGMWYVRFSDGLVGCYDEEELRLVERSGQR